MSALAPPALHPAAARLGADTVRCAPAVAGRSVPLLIEPVDPALAELYDSTGSSGATDAFVAWFRERRADIDTLLAEYGALLLRGFALPDTAAFGRLGALFAPYANGYTAGAAPRRQVAGDVYESTRMPPPFKIGLHQEMAYMPSFPRLLAFYCRKPADSGGETPICDMRRLTARLPAGLRERFAARGVMYLRNFAAPGDRAERLAANPNLPFAEYHRPWDEAFGTAEREQAQALCEARGLGWRWLGDGSLTVSHVGPALRRHPRTGETVWFNQASAQHPNPRSMGDFSFRHLQRRYAGRAAFPYEIRYGDGAPMPAADLDAVYDAFDAEEVAFVWRTGDLMIVDNMLVAHGRNPFRGTRDTQVMLLD
ncbi:TauD/TfdA family dioxygenase [Burkholderia gladioli]|uniref:TauD/TfdA family dioxygenase n=1 Tax=Burkholderia gladioli TaxID=28095 RepID=UPI0034DB57A5